MPPPSPSPGRAYLAEFCSARSETIPPLPWTNFAPPFPRHPCVGGGPMDRAAHPAESRRRRVRPGATEPTPRERRFSLPQDGARGPRLRTSRRQSRSIRVTWDDGIAGTFHHLWLRDNRVSNLRHEYLRLPTRDSANIAAESTIVRAEVRPRSRNPLQCCRPFLIVAGVTGWRMKH